MNRKVGVLMSYILMVFEVLSTLLLTPFIIRTLGQSEYGVYKLVVAINAYLLLLDLGVGNAITRYVSKYRAENDERQGRKFLGVATLFYLFIGIITILIGFILVSVFPTAFAKGLSSDEIKLGQRLLGITMLNSAVTLGTAAYTNVIIAYERFIISKGATILQILIRMLLTVIALEAGMGSYGIVCINLLLTILCKGFFVLYVLFRIKLRPIFRGIELSFVKEIVAYSSLILLQMIATQLNASVDQVLLGSLVASSSAIIGVYGVGTQIVQYFQSIGSAFTGVLMPGTVRLVESGADNDQLTKEMIRIGRIIFIVLMLIWSGFFVCGQQFVILWAGKENNNAFIVAIILMTAYSFTITEEIGTQILWAKNQHKEQSFLKLIVVLTNIILTVFFIKWNPLVGATLGTFIALMFGDVGVMNLIFVKKLKIKIRSFYLGLFKGIIPSVFTTVVIGIIVRQFIHGGWGAFLLNCFIICAVYSICMYFFGLNDYEKNLINSLLMDLKKKVGRKQ